MKVSLFGVTGVPLGKHKVKDVRLDQIDKLVEADKKSYAQVDVVGQEDAVTSDAIVASTEGELELIINDLESVETRLERNPPAAEKAALEKVKAALEGEKTIFKAGLTAEELLALGAHSFLSAKPVIVAEAADLADFDALLVRVVAEAGMISFVTVGGPENRAWLVKKGSTAPEAAGSIHTDMHKGFIRAEIISFADLVAAGGEAKAKHANKLRLETKQYVMQDYDITNFRINK